MESKKILHGNKAKIWPQKHVESLYQANIALGTDDEDVEYARSFVNENKK